MSRLITAESVAYGHPDKISDQISDGILDAIISIDKNAKIALETMVKDNTVVLGGEITTNANINYKEVVKNIVSDFGYSLEHGFHPSTLTLINLIGTQSPEINGAVVKENGEMGASDQGFMIGYADNSTDNYMPLAIHISKKIVDSVVKMGGLGPDAKSQVTVEEMADGSAFPFQSKRIHTILVSTMHNKAMNLESVREEVTKLIKNGHCDLSDDIMNLIDDDTKIVVNCAGSWNVGGAISDCGLTGRKIVVDQYGPYCPVGGGAFSGKYNHVDRIGAYVARYIAKNIVASGLSNKCKVELSYMIGIAEPASINVDTFGGYENDLELTDVIRKTFPMTPKQIVDYFDLETPIYNDTARNGHFGRANLPWEQLDKVNELKSLLKVVPESNRDF